MFSFNISTNNPISRSSQPPPVTAFIDPRDREGLLAFQLQMGDLESLYTGPHRFPEHHFLFAKLLHLARRLNIFGNIYKYAQDFLINRSTFDELISLRERSNS